MKIFYESTMSISAAWNVKSFSEEEFKLNTEN